MNYNVAIVGPEDMISGFVTLGAKPFNAKSGTDVYEVIRSLQKKTERNEEKYAVVIVIEKYLKEMTEEEYQKITGKTLPAIVALPGIEGSSGFSEEKLKKLTERAIGADIA